MNNLTFYSNYCSEKACVEFLKPYYQKSIESCTNCGCKNQKWYDSFFGWRCLKCSKKVSLKSISFMRDSNKSFTEWMEILHLMIDTKKACSIKEILRLSQQTRYETVFHMIRKIQQELALINRREIQECHALIDFSELQGNYPKLPAKLEVFINLSRQRTRDQIRLVLPRDIENHELQIKHKLLCDCKYQFPKLLKHQNSSFTEIGKCGHVYLNERWMKKVKENLTKVLGGIHHELSLFHLQGKLDEYCFKYNHRDALKSKLIVFFESLRFEIRKNSVHSEEG